MVRCLLRALTPALSRANVARKRLALTPTLSRKAGEGDRIRLR